MAMNEEARVRIERREDSSSTRIMFTDQPDDSRVSAVPLGATSTVYIVYPKSAAPSSTLTGPWRRAHRVVQRRPAVTSWRAPIARAIKEPEQSEDVALVWRSFLRFLGRTVPAGRPVEPGADLSVAEAAVLARGSTGLDVSSATTARALGRTAARWAGLLTDSANAAEAARLLGVQESRVRQRLADRTLYGFKHEGVWRVPRFQFYHDRPVPGVAAVFPRLPDTVTPIAVETWFTTPTMELVSGDHALSPREWLITGGDPTAVATLAAFL